MWRNTEKVRAKIHYHLTPGEALKIARELQGLSKNELSQLTNLTQSNFSAIERGTSQLGRERAMILARALKVHSAILLFPDYDVSLAA